MKFYKLILKLVDVIIEEHGYVQPDDDLIFECREMIQSLLGLEEKKQ